uniref:hypothetical protein n=1 Tax=Hydrocytium acuminatum TaxID=1745963 RepID=UPI002A81F85C|nr:hypothetical protein UYM18_pgp114 [Hydrocytium acuminatum]WOR09506.1 hypothetical protein [Hydrocytium acuminatum]
MFNPFINLSNFYKILIGDNVSIVNKKPIQKIKSIKVKRLKNKKHKNKKMNNQYLKTNAENSNSLKITNFRIRKRPRNAYKSFYQPILTPYNILYDLLPGHKTNDPENSKKPLPGSSIRIIQTAYHWLQKAPINKWMLNKSGQTRRHYLTSLIHGWGLQQLSYYTLAKIMNSLTNLKGFDSNSYLKMKLFGIDNLKNGNKNNNKNKKYFKF